MNPITVFTPYPELTTIFEALREHCPVNFDIHELLCDETVPVARKAVEQGCKIIIARGETASILKNELDTRETYILEIPITDCDRLTMLTKALEYGTNIAIIGFGVSLNMSNIIKNIVSTDVVLKFYKISSAAEVNTIFENAIGDGFKIIAGTPLAVKNAHKYGAVGIPLLTERSCAESVLRDAVQLSNIFEKGIRAEMPSAEIHKINSILFDFHGGVIADTTSIDSKTRQKIAAEASRASKQSTVYGCKITPTGKLHYIINYIGNAAKKIHSCCYLCHEQEPSPPSGAEARKCTFDKFITYDEDLRNSIAFLKEIAATNATLIIHGDTGTGKSMLAAAVHAASARADNPFISINCATIPETLIESELFGYSSGAFTGASRRGKKGYFELAHGGTIFLDEVSELSLSAQTKILKFIEERTFMPVGSEEFVSVDVRIICATNKPLRQLVMQNVFRSDLYYRLNVFEFKIPSLRQRRTDILPLVQKFIALFNETYQHNFQLTPELAQLLQEYDYPGNVRELRNYIERIILTSKLNMPMKDMLRWLNMHENEHAVECSATRQGDLRLMERTHILQTLESAGDSRAKAAKMLGISKSTLWRKCREYGIKER